MSKVQLAVGQVWKDRGGREGTITRKDDHDKYPFYGSNDETYTPDGTEYDNLATAEDLIELVQDENGWRPWKATADSQCPVADGTQVLVRLACGTASKEHDPRRADEFIWSELPTSSIVAYKIVEEASKPTEPAAPSPDADGWIPYAGGGCPVEPVHAEAHSAQHREAQEAPAIRLLQVAADHMRARAATYDKPDGERSMGKTVVAFNAVTGRDLSEAEGWLLLQLLKDVRLFQRPGYHADSAEDCIAYSALKAEAKMAEGE